MPMFVCCLKLSVELYLQIASMLITSVMSEAIEVVLNYVAFLVISELDEIYYGQVKSKLKEDLEIRDFEIPIYNHQKINLKRGLRFVDHVLLCIIEFMYLIYDLTYFHFAPYCIFILIYQWKKVDAIEDFPA